MKKAIITAYLAARKFKNNAGFELSGYIAFTGFLALFPFLIFIVALAGFLGDEDIAIRVIDLSFEYLPYEVADTLFPTIHEVLTSHNGGLLTFGIIGTLWVASSGVEALRTGLNRAYGAKQIRPLWLRRPQSMLIVIIAGSFMIAASVAIVAGPVIWKGVNYIIPLPENWHMIYSLTRYGVATLFLCLVVSTLHMWLPKPTNKFRDIWIGSLIFSVLWLLLASVFSIYLKYLGNFSVTYGSLGGIIITLIFFYFSAVIFIYGAEVNAVIPDKQK